MSVENNIIAEAILYDVSVPVRTPAVSNAPAGVSDSTDLAGPTGPTGPSGPSDESCASGATGDSQSVQGASEPRATESTSAGRKGLFSYCNLM